MDPGQFFAASGVLIVAGKGGVGKTVVSAALGRAAARIGLNALMIDVQGRSGLGHLYGVPPLTYETVRLMLDRASDGRVRGRVLSPDEALVEWLEERGMRRVARRMARSGVLEVVATATPGIKDLLVLAKIKQLEKAKGADVIIVDAPAAGHAITFLQSAATLEEAARVGAIHSQAREVLDLLQDPERCRVMLVTLPEETPVNELVQTAFSLEDEVGVALGPVVVNGTLPLLDLDGTAPEAPADVVDDLAAAVELRRRRQTLQTAQIDRLGERLPLPQLHLAQRFGADLGPGDLEGLADELLAGIADLGVTT